MVLVRVAALSTAVLSTGNARDRPGIESPLVRGERMTIDLWFEWCPSNTPVELQHRLDPG